MLKKILLGAVALGLSGLAGCAVYVPGPAVAVGPGVVVAGPPLVLGGIYPHRYGYYGYYGWHRGYWR